MRQKRPSQEALDRADEMIADRREEGRPVIKADPYADWDRKDMTTHPYFHLICGRVSSFSDPQEDE